MAKGKRTDLDKTISRLQKNARNKIYRLRKAGASAEELEAIDPRRSTRGMNGSQKAAYARRLERFNARSNGYVMSEDYFGNKALIPRPLIDAYRAAERETNKVIRKVKERAIRMYGSRDFFSSGDTQGKPKEEWDRIYGPMRQSSYNAGYLEEVHREYGFGSVEAVKRAIAGVKGKIDKLRKVDNNLTNYKRYIVNKMESEGAAPEAVRAVKSLTKSQLQYLYFNSDFSDVVSVYQYEEYYEQGYLRSQQVIDISDRQILDMVKTAKRNVPRGPFSALTRGV